MGTWVARLPQTVGAGKGGMEQWGVPDPRPWQHSSGVPPLPAVALSPRQGQPFDFGCHQPSYSLAY